MNFILIMRGVALFVLVFTLYNVVAQEKVMDSTWTVNDNTFQIELFSIEKSNDKVNTYFSIKKNGQTKFKDSLFSLYQSIKLIDINLDSFVDLLIHHTTGARANDTYHLFLYDPSSSEYEMISEFRKWPNMRPTDIPGIIYSEILTDYPSYKFFAINANGEFIDLEVLARDSLMDKNAFQKGLMIAQERFIQLKNNNDD